MTSNNETVSRSFPPNAMSGQHCENYDVKRETVHCYPRNVDRCYWSLSALFKIYFRYVLLYNKSLNDWSLGEQWILFPSNLNVSLDFVSGNIAILGKQNSLFPSGPVIKCLMFPAGPVIKCLVTKLSVSCVLCLVSCVCVLFSKLEKTVKKSFALHRLAHKFAAVSRSTSWSRGSLKFMLLFP